MLETSHQKGARNSWRDQTNGWVSSVSSIHFVHMGVHYKALFLILHLNLSGCPNPWFRGGKSRKFVRWWFKTIWNNLTVLFPFIHFWGFHWSYKSTIPSSEATWNPPHWPALLARHAGDRATRSASKSGQNAAKSQSWDLNHSDQRSNFATWGRDILLKH